MADISTSCNALSTPVLFLVFNRPETTEQVFEAIRQVRPLRLYIAADGPREGYELEAELVSRVRAIVTKVDWDCEVKTLLRNKNLGCKYAVSEAITWFFAQEEMGIILEDDCLPSLSFFMFSEQMLKHQKENKSVWMISGFNPRYPGLHSSKYFYSQNPSVWGWATWRDRWDKYNVEMSFWSNKSKLILTPEVPMYVYQYYKNAFKNTKNGSINTWDYQLACLILINGGFVVKPYANLIKNIGILGTHSAKVLPNHNVELGEFILSKFNPEECKLDIYEDLWFYKKNFKKKYFKRLLSKIRSSLKQVSLFIKVE
jgi:hypothetical protein